tara:strand:+ start:3469 stop:4149 length:681 start_codon:yes stop_codon:yes gene_type:complete
MEKPLKVAAWSGVGVFVVSIISSLIQQVLIFSGVSMEVARVVGSPFSVVSLGLGILFLYGFVVLAERFDATLLKVMAWIGIVMYSVFLLFAVLGFVFGLAGVSLSPGIIDLSPIEELSEFDFESGDFDGEGFGDFVLGIFVFLIIIWLIIAIPMSIYFILFGVGMLKLKKDVPLAKASAILNIIAGATVVIFVGFFVGFAAYVVEVVMMFKASKKFEKKGSRKRKK